MKFLCEQCKAKYQIADEKAAGKTVRMKCRKCGYLIEVRAAATEGGMSSVPPSGRSSAPPAAPGTRPLPPRAPLATSLASARSPMKPERSGALAGALRTAIQRDEEVSAPVDMSDLSAGDEWYVAINGVPVGPIRMAEVRRKAAIGAVTEESLCWQEGLDEWRALRSFPELAAIVREAFSSGRSSMTPRPPDGRLPPQPPPRTSVRPTPPTPAAGTPPRPPPPRNPSTSAPLPVAARSNVVPFTSRLATAEKLAEEPDDLTRPFMGPPISDAEPVRPSVVPDPFAPPPRAAMAPGAPFGGAAVDAASPFAPQRAPSVSLAPQLAQQKKAPPWMAIAMVAAAAAFGVTAGIAVFLRPAAAPTPVVVQVPGSPAAVAATATTTAAATSPTSDPTASAAATPSATRGPLVAAVSTKASPAPTASSTAPSKGPLDLHGLTGVNVGPSDDPGSEAPRAPGQCLSEAQVTQVIGMHSVGLRRSCWERNTSSKLAANVTVSLTIGGDGSAQGVSASGDDPAVANCIAGDVRNWHFPAMGCSQKTAIPFHFVKQ